MRVSTDLAGQSHTRVLALDVQVRRLVVEPRVGTEAGRKLSFSRWWLNALVVLVDTFR